jgi:hypothetical protein
MEMDEISFKQIQELADESGYVHVALREFNKKNKVDWKISELQPSTLSLILQRAQELKDGLNGIGITASDFEDMRKENN